LKKRVDQLVYDASPSLIRNILVTIQGYRFYRKRYTGCYKSILGEVRDSRRWTSEQVQSYQNEKLHLITKHCRHNIPYYQQLFGDYDYHENDFTSVSDITKLPILTKEILRKEEAKIKAQNVKPFFIQHTSGSTGSPLEIWVDEVTYKMAMALLVDHEENHGVRFGDRRATFAGRMIKPSAEMSAPYSFFNKAENQRIFSSYHLNDNTFDAYSKELESFDPIEIIGYPSAIYDLSRRYLKSNKSPKFKPKAIITNSETLLVWQKETIETVFDCEVYDYYGTAEYIVFAGQSSDKSYRLNPLIGITELLPNSYSSESKRLVATTLTNEVMPLLRYETGDQCVIDDRYSSAEQIIKSFVGRLDDYVTTKDGRKIGRLDHIFKGMKDVHEAQIIQNSIYNFTINLVCDPLKLNELKNEIEENLKARIGSEIDVTIQSTRAINRAANGKFRSVISYV
jgi:phenylacetate-CoA ligase